jgi:hypothetical protein
MQMLASTKQTILTIFFALFALFAVIAPAEAVAIGNVFCGLFIAFVAIFAIFAFIGWFSQRGQASSSNVEDEAE